MTSNIVPMQNIFRSNTTVMLVINENVCEKEVTSIWMKSGLFPFSCKYKQINHVLKPEKVLRRLHTDTQTHTL